MEIWASHTLGKCCITELHPNLANFSFWICIYYCSYIYVWGGAFIMYICMRGAFIMYICTMGAFIRYICMRGAFIRYICMRGCIYCAYIHIYEGVHTNGCIWRSVLWRSQSSPFTLMYFPQMQMRLWGFLSKHFTHWAVLTARLIVDTSIFSSVSASRLLWHHSICSC